MSRPTFVQIALIATLLAAGPNPAFGQQAIDTAQTSKPSSDAYDEYFMSDEHRRKIYDTNRKRPSKAVLYSLLLPGMGNIYAEQYLIAGIEFVLVVFAGTFVAYGASTSQPRIMVLGGVTAGLAYGSGIATSVVGVNQHNRKLRQGLKVGDEIAELWAPPIVFRF